MKVHADDCPALQKNLCLPLDVVHACTCTAQADLAELVERAEFANAAMVEMIATEGRSPEEKLLLVIHQQELDAALKPFRERKS